MKRDEAGSPSEPVEQDTSGFVRSKQGSQVEDGHPVSRQPVKGQILRSASVVAVITLISRICGYLRDQRIALLLGTSPAADAFVLAFRIPNLIRRVTGGGALGASFIPVFTGYLREKPRDEALRFAQKVFWDVAVILAVVAIAGAIFSKQVVSIFTLLGHGAIRWDLAIYLNRIIFPCVLFIGLAALVSAALNSFHVFGLPAATSVVFNLVFIVFSMGWAYRLIVPHAQAGFRTPAVALACGVLAGAVAQFAMQVPALARRGMKFSPAVSFSDPGVRKIGRLMGPSLFGMGVYQINFFMDTIFATSPRMPQGSVASLYVGDRMMELVLGTYATAISTVLLPMMSHQAAAGEYEGMKKAFGFSLRVVSFITIPAALGLMVLRRPVIETLFQHGAFSAESVTLTARGLFYYALGLPAFAAIKLIAPLFYAVQDTATPAWVGAYALGANILFNSVFLLFFVGRLSNGGPALASSLAAAFNFALLFFLFRKRYGPVGARSMIAAFGKMLVCGAAMATVAWEGLRFWRSGQHHVVAQAGLLAGMIVVSAAVYFGMAWVMRCEELGEMRLLVKGSGKEA